MIKNIFRKLVWRIRTRWFPRPGPHRYLMKDNPTLARFNIGGYSYGLPKILFSNSGAMLTVGKFSSLADDVVIMLGGEHRVDWATTFPLQQYYAECVAIQGHPATKGDIVIGNDVWIGREVLILSGVTIGDGAVIGARALITKDVMPYSIVGGNPARHIRFRFDADSINELRRIAWWEWPEENIREATPYLLSSNISALVNFYEKRVRVVRKL